MQVLGRLQARGLLRSTASTDLYKPTPIASDGPHGLSLIGDTANNDE